MPDPGLRSAVSPTSDWKDPQGAYAWSVFRPVDSRRVLRISGFTDSWVMARAKALLTHFQ